MGGRFGSLDIFLFPWALFTLIARLISREIRCSHGCVLCALDSIGIGGGSSSNLFCCVGAREILATKVAPAVDSSFDLTIDSSSYNGSGRSPVTKKSPGMHVLALFFCYIFVSHVGMRFLYCTAAPLIQKNLFVNLTRIRKYRMRVIGVNSVCKQLAYFIQCDHFCN